MACLRASTVCYVKNEILITQELFYLGQRQNDHVHLNFHILYLDMSFCLNNEFKKGSAFVNIFILNIDMMSVGSELELSHDRWRPSILFTYEKSLNFNKSKN